MVSEGLEFQKNLAESFWLRVLNKEAVARWELELGYGGMGGGVAGQQACSSRSCLPVVQGFVIGPPG